MKIEAAVTILIGVLCQKAWQVAVSCQLLCSCCFIVTNLVFAGITHDLAGILKLHSKNLFFKNWIETVKDL